MNGSSINYYLIKNDYDFDVKGSRQKMQWLQDTHQSNTLIYTVQDVKLADISGNNEGISEY